MLYILKSMDLFPSVIREYFSNCRLRSLIDTDTEMKLLVIMFLYFCLKSTVLSSFDYLVKLLK